VRAWPPGEPAARHRETCHEPQRNQRQYRDIADANQNQLNGSVNLKIGQTLIIPQ